MPAEAVRSIPDALARLERSEADLARHPVLHGPAGTLFTVELPDPKGKGLTAGIWLGDSGATFLVAIDAPVRSSVAHGLSGNGARLLDLFAEATRRYLEVSEELDAKLAVLQDRGADVAARDVWALQREAARLRGQIARAAVVAVESSTAFTSSFPGSDRAMPFALRELDRARDLVVQVQQSLSDLILLKNAEESNRIAATANRLSEFSNRIAVLTNTSNIRMLGITYVALLLGLVSATVLIPNTAATILGMPSAAWVPGLWVDVILVILGLVPILVVFSRPWVIRLLGELRESESRTSEGLRDLPELPESSVAKAAGTPPK